MAKREARSAEASQPRGRDGRPKKTAEELDADMADYFNPNPAAPAAEKGANTGAAAPAADAGDDIDMIE